MGDTVVTSVVSIALAIIGIAALAVIVSRNAQTTQVIGAAGGAFSNSLSTALSPLNSGGALSSLTGGGSAGSFTFQ